MSITPCSSTDSFSDQEPDFKRIRFGNETDNTSETESIELLPQEMLINIFGFLPFGCLDVAARVCRSWHRAASNVSLLRPYCYPSPECEDFSIVTVPQELSTLNALLKWAEGKKIKMGTVDREVLNKFGGREEKGKWLMSEFEVDGTEDLPFEAQKEKISSYEGFEMQSIVPALALNLFTFLRTGNWLLGDDPLTYIRCKDNIMLGGATSEHGPNIRRYDEKAPHIYAGAMVPIADQGSNLPL